MIEQLKAIVAVSPEYAFIGHPVNYATQSGSTKNSAMTAERTSSRLYKLTLSMDAESTITKFKLTNSGIIIWDDFWTSSKLSEPRDPHIKILELQNSITLNSVNIPYLRPSLQEVNLAGCKNLSYINLSQAPALERLWLDRCYSINEIHLGFNKSIKSISIRGCGLSEQTLEQLLSEYIPTKAAVKRSGTTMEHDSFMDLRENVIPWENRRIASKIRMLLCNNVAVAWSSNPPERVIPAELYRTFSI